MCGRYKVSTPGDELWETFDVHGDNMPPLVARYNVAPTDRVPVIRSLHHGELLRWGIKLPNPKAAGFNVRVESLGAPFYRDSIQGRRCLILADGFYEWKALVEAKQPYLIQRQDKKPFAFAGLWDKVTLRNGETVDACAILTTTPRGVMPQVHDRMPVILRPEHYEAWLDPKSPYKALVEPDADELELIKVSPLVNSVKNDGPELIKPVSA
ncbi:MAG: SOS response-associated peptidase [Polyangiaceae bacterium]